MCGEQVGSRHGHVVDTEHRSILCACRPCYLLFTRDDTGKFRAIPERYAYLELSQQEWQSLGIPVSTAFFLRGESGLTAFYPSPAGATECLLDLDAWAILAKEYQVVGSARPEVEAILIRDTGSLVECYLVPIDMCYQLVGTVRVYWKGFDGGQEAEEEITRFFKDLRSRSGA